MQLPFEAPLALFGARTPRVYHVCADIWAFANRSSRFAGWKRLPALGMGGLIDRIQARLFRRSDVRVVTNGEDLRAHYGRPPGRAVVSSTIRDDEILSVPRKRTLDAPFRVLFVGYIRHEKGTDLLVKAFDRVLDVLPDAELDVIGALDHGSSCMAGGFEDSLIALQGKGTVRYSWAPQFRSGFVPVLCRCGCSRPSQPNRRNAKGIDRGPRLWLSRDWHSGRRHSHVDHRWRRWATHPAGGIDRVGASDSSRGSRRGPAPAAYRRGHRASTPLDRGDICRGAGRRSGDCGLRQVTCPSGVIADLSPHLGKKHR